MAAYVIKITIFKIIILKGSGGGVYGKRHVSVYFSTIHDNLAGDVRNLLSLINF